MGCALRKFDSKVSPSLPEQQPSQTSEGETDEETALSMNPQQVRTDDDGRPSPEITPPHTPTIESLKPKLIGGISVIELTDESTFVNIECLDIRNEVDDPDEEWTVPGLIVEGGPVPRRICRSANRDGKRLDSNDIIEQLREANLITTKKFIRNGGVAWSLTENLSSPTLLSPSQNLRRPFRLASLNIEQEKKKLRTDGKSEVKHTQDNIQNKQGRNRRKQAKRLGGTLDTDIDPGRAATATKSLSSDRLPMDTSEAADVVKCVNDGNSSVTREFPECEEMHDGKDPLLQGDSGVVKAPWNSSSSLLSLQTEPRKTSSEGTQMMCKTPVPTDNRSTGSLHQTNEDDRASKETFIINKSSCDLNKPYAGRRAGLGSAGLAKSTLREDLGRHRLTPDPLVLRCDSGLAQARMNRSGHSLHEKAAGEEIERQAYMPSLLEVERPKTRVVRKRRPRSGMKQRKETEPEREPMDEDTANN